MFTIKKKLARLKNISFSKRKEYVVITLLLTSGLVFLQTAAVELRFWFLLALILLTYIFSLIGLRENMKGIRWILLPLLPTLFTAAVGLFYFLLPVRWLTRIPVAVLYAICMYAIMLVENIYNVAINRSIQLLRVAHAVGFLATLTTLFLLLNTVFSLRFNFYINFLLVLLVSFPLVLQSLWSIVLTPRVGKDLILFTVFFTLLLAQIGLCISFWPVKPIMASLFLTTSAYTLLGIGQHHFAKRLFSQNILEFTRVFIIVFILIIVTTQYR